MPLNSKKGARRQLVWKPRVEGAPNHYLDCEVYGAALAELANAPTLREHSPRVGEMSEKELAAAPAQLERSEPEVPMTTPRPHPKRKNRGGSWGGGHGGGFLG